MNTLRMSKSFALRAMGAAAVYKALQSIDSEHVFSSNGIVRNFGEVASVGALCFNAAMSRYSQPHVVHAMKEVASGRVTLTTGQWVVSLLRGAGGQAGCLALFSYGTMRGCLALSDIALLSECGPLALLANLPGNFMTIVIGLVFFGLTMVPISMPLFGVSYLFGAALGQRLGNRLLRSSGTWLSSTGDSHFRIIGRLYETRPLLAQSGMFGFATAIFMPSHLHMWKWDAFEKGGDGSWSYYKSYGMDNYPDHKNNSSSIPPKDEVDSFRNGINDKSNNFTHFSDDSEIDGDGGVDI